MNLEGGVVGASLALPQGPSRPLAQLWRPLKRGPPHPHPPVGLISGAPRGSKAGPRTGGGDGSRIGCVCVCFFCSSEFFRFPANVGRGLGGLTRACWRKAWAWASCAKATGPFWPAGLPKRNCSQEGRIKGSRRGSNQPLPPGMRGHIQAPPPATRPPLLQPPQEVPSSGPLRPLFLTHRKHHGGAGGAWPSV